MKLGYDEYKRVYCWAPFDSRVSSFFNTSEKAIEEAKTQICCDNILSEIDFSDYISIINKDIIFVDNSGIVYKAINGNAFISFKECAHNYEHLNGGSGKCIGEGDITGQTLHLLFSQLR